MIRRYDEWVADLFDVVPGRLVLLGLFLATLTGAVLWYSFPSWIPRHLPRLYLPRLRPRRPRRARRTVTADPAPPTRHEPARVRDPAPIPDPDAESLAAQGRYDEAIRRRLRDTVTDLTRAGVVAPHPGMTAAEIAAAAAGRRPGLAPALDAAVELFSAVWYGARPAGQEQDDRMRAFTDEVRGDTGNRP